MFDVTTLNDKLSMIVYRLANITEVSVFRKYNWIFHRKLSNTYSKKGVLQKLFQPSVEEILKNCKQRCKCITIMLHANSRIDLISVLCKRSLVYLRKRYRPRIKTFDAYRNLIKFDSILLRERTPRKNYVYEEVWLTTKKKKKKRE